MRPFAAAGSFFLVINRQIDLPVRFLDSYVSHCLFRLFHFCPDLPTGTEITTNPSNTTALRQSVMSLNCTTDANPVAHVYHFYFSGVLIGNSSSGVFNITVETDGVYTCVPVNTVGTGDNATVSITAVGGYPSNNLK